MPTYDTPEPIDLAINLRVGGIEVIASDRADTVVTVRPTNPAKDHDRRGAEATRVEFDGQRVTIVGPRPRITVFGPNESVEIKVELPNGSRLTAENAVGGVRAIGRLGATRIKASMGAIELDATADLSVRASLGSVTVGRADGAVDVTADHGQIRVGSVTGDALLKASHGSILIEESGGNVEARLSYGDLEVGRALASVSTKTSYGSIRIGEASLGSIDVESAMGQIDIGVRNGVPAWLDLSSKSGRVRNELDRDSAPHSTEQTVAIRGRSQVGDITVHRTR